MADASQVPDAWQPVAGILSCFSLQQMAQPVAVLAAWAAALAPGGVLAVAYWCALLRLGQAVLHALGAVSSTLAGGVCCRQLVLHAL